MESTPCLSSGVLIPVMTSRAQISSLPVEANNSIVKSYDSSLSVEAEQKLVTTNVPDTKCKSNSPAKYYLPVVAINLTVESESLRVEANNSIVESYNSSLSVEAEQKLAATNVPDAKCKSNSPVETTEMVKSLSSPIVYQPFRRQVFFAGCW